MIQHSLRKLCFRPLFFMLILIPAVGLTQQIPTSVAASLARQITVKVQTSDDKLGTGFFIHPCGMIFADYSLILTTSAGQLMLPDFSGANFKVILSSKEEGFAVLIVDRKEDVPKLSKIEFRDYKTLQEAETLVSRSAIDDGPLCTWLGTVAFVESPNDNFSVIQTIATRTGGGAPFLDLDGKLVGYLSGTVDASPLRFASMKRCSRAVEAIQNAPQYDQCFNDAFKDYQFEFESVVLRGSSNLNGKKIKDVDGIAVDSLHDLKLICWSAHERGQTELELNVQQGSKIETVRISTNKK